MSMDKESLAAAGLGTRSIYGGVIEDSQFGSLTTPIYQSSTFVFDTNEQGARRFQGEEDGYIYGRLGNPTVAVAERKIAELEGAEAALGTASGMGAIASTLWTIAGAGKHIIADAVLYGCTFVLLAHDMTRYGVEVSMIDMSDLEQVKAALKENTCCVYLETPTNPNLKIADIEEIARIAHEYNPEIKVVCDNTFASPALQNPIKLGADVVVHSATKYINGHGDLLAGFICGKKDFIGQVLVTGFKNMTGAVMDPHAASLIIRSMKTFEIRVARHCESARKVADYLVNNDKVEVVYYPGLESHPGHEIAKKQMKDFGGVVSFEVKGGREAGARFCNALKMLRRAVSLGACETLIEHAATMTHSTYTPEELAEAGISPTLIRLSVGLENPEDIIADMQQAFDQI